MASSVEASLKAADEDQVRMMEEQVIMVDYNDRAIGAGSKKETHIMTNINGGMLHRAFSVFLFTPDGKLVLQQRAKCKITFPLIWANTCCSHPLHIPSEMIEEEAMGVKNAARRKLEQELGIPPEDVPLESFTWITRVHYYGACKACNGLWGEHEIDWILLCTPKKMPRMALNENEVNAVRAFTQAELKEWMATRAVHGNEVSPWFGVMEKQLVYKWWDAVLAKRIPSVIERDVIYRQHDLEAAAEGVAAKAMPVPFAATLAATTAAAASAAAAGGSATAVAKGSRAGTAVGAAASAASVAAAHIPGASVGGTAGANVAKQGAYGKVKVHSDSMLSQLSHLDEVWAGLLFKLGAASVAKVKPLPADASPSHLFCERMLVKTSRSFAMVIQQLPDHLRMSVCVFYLVLRGLDTVEDDMEAFKGRQAEKLAHLRAFHKYLRDPAFHMEGVGEGDEADLLRQFYHVNAVFASLPAVDRDVIADICDKMGEGMAQYCGRDLREGTDDLADYNRYCFYVAGLVGEGLTRLWVAHGDEEASIAQDLKLADEMGLFLQKTNIIRDYLEDLVEGRAFWPREIWSQYSPGLANLRHKVAAAAGSLARDPADPSAPAPSTDDLRFQEDQARACLNHLVADALTLAPSCLRYMERLRHPDVFRFCAIPQLMAVATLEKLANNADVFTGVVKIRKGQALRLLMESNNMQNVYLNFLRYTRSIVAAIPPHHTKAYALATAAGAQIEQICLDNLPNGAALLAVSPVFSPQAVLLVCVVFGVLMRYMYYRSRSGAWDHGMGTYLPRVTDSWDVAALAAICGCIMYLFAMAGVPVVFGGNGGGSTGGNTGLRVSPSTAKLAAGESTSPASAGSGASDSPLVGGAGATGEDKVRHRGGRRRSTSKARA